MKYSKHKKKKESITHKNFSLMTIHKCRECRTDKYQYSFPRNSLEKEDFTVLKTMNEKQKIRVVKYVRYLKIQVGFKSKKKNTQKLKYFNC